MLILLLPGSSINGFDPQNSSGWKPSILFDYKNNIISQKMKHSDNSCSTLLLFVTPLYSSFSLLSLSETIKLINKVTYQQYKETNFYILTQKNGVSFNHYF